MHIADLYQLFLQHTGVETDTRKLQPGNLFFALKGPNFNGNAFAAQALAAGASYAIIDEPEYQAERCILVADALQTLQELAGYHRSQLQIPILAITGSNGKTTTKELITTVLRSGMRTCATEGNLNNHIGVPLTLLRIGREAGIAVVEMGANHIGEIADYCRIARPTHGLITNCGKAHIEGFGSEAGVRRGKGELYDFLRQNGGTVFRNTDLDYLAEMARGIEKQVLYGSANAHYTGRPLQQDVLLQLAVLSAGAEMTIQTQLVGAYNFPNVMAAVAVGLHFGLTADQVRGAIEAYNPGNSRSQWLQKGSNSIILDAYNANPTSMRAAIDNFARTSLPHKMLWIGAMKEMGPDEAAEHRELLAYMDRFEWESIILVGQEFKPFSAGRLWFPDAAAAAGYVRQHQPSGATILIKGSRGSRMEQLLEAL